MDPTEIYTSAFSALKIPDVAGHWNNGEEDEKEEKQEVE